MSGSLAHEFAKVLERHDFVARHDRALMYKRGLREAGIARVPEWEDLRARARMLKAGARRNLEEFLARFTSEASSMQARVRYAKTAEEANRIVLGICRDHRATRLVKSKSMTTEECGLNPFLEKHGIRITDTDLGERIVQLFGEPPSHIVTPAIHRSRKEIGELFAAHGLVEPGEDDPVRLTEAARRSLRELFLEAEVGVTGANFLVVETGTVVVIENEANSLIGTSLPRVHVVVAGIEKLVRGYADLAVFLALLARSATGQRLTAYTTHYRGPQPSSAGEETAGLAPRELHIILLDNGRRALLGTPAEEGLACIRCGACLNACPVFRRVGGHAYDYVYPGPIGAVLGPGLAGVAKADLPKASSLCGLCSEVCPVGIELAKHIHEWRAELRGRGTARRVLPPGLAFLMRHPRLWDRSLSFVKSLGRLGGLLMRRSPWVRAYSLGRERRLPEVPAESFRQWWKHRGTAGGSETVAGTGTEARLAALPKAERVEKTARPPEKERDLEDIFAEALEEAGGECIELAGLPDEAVATEKARPLLDRLGRSLPPAPAGKHELNGLPWLVATARRRIARTGSLWVDFEDLESRAQLLLSEGLVLLVERSSIVYDLPEAYGALEDAGVSACATFVTGPSKTADIELTVVKGAHGPRRLLVLAY